MFNLFVFLSACADVIEFLIEEDASVIPVIIDLPPEEEHQQEPQFRIGKKTNTRYKVKYKWPVERQPEIVLCPDSKVTIAQLQKAKSFWTDEGFAIGMIAKAKTREVCEKEFIHNSIMFSTVRYKDFFHNVKIQGATTVWTQVYSDTTMIGAFVEIRNVYADDDSLVIHEMGHALGLGHTNVDGHLMNEFHSLE